MKKRIMFFVLLAVLLAVFILLNYSSVQSNENIEIINISKKSGGAMISIIRTSAFSISSTISLEDEIHTSIAAKNFEL